MGVERARRSSILIETAVKKTQLPCAAEIARKCAISSWVRPHDWCLVDHECKWNQDVARELLSELAETEPSPVVGASQVLVYYQLAGCFPILHSGEEWIPSQSCVRHLVGEAYDPSTLPTYPTFAVDTEKGRVCCLAYTGSSADGRVSKVEWRATPAMRMTVGATPTSQKVTAERSLGKEGEERVSRALETVCLSHGYELTSTFQRARSADFQVKMPGGTVLVEVKNYSRPLPQAEREKLNRDLCVQSAIGALMIIFQPSTRGTVVDSSFILGDDGTFKPVISIQLQGDATSACAIGLGCVQMLAQRAAAARAGTTSLDLLDGVASRLEYADKALGEAIHKERSTASEILTRHQHNLSTLVAARGNIATCTSIVREQTKTKTYGVGRSWESFLAMSHVPIANLPEVKAVWERLWGRTTDSEPRWEVEKKGGASEISLVGKAETHIRCLATTSSLVVELSAIPRETLFNWLTHPTMEKMVKVANGRVEVKITAQTLPELLPELGPP